MNFFIYYSFDINVYISVKDLLIFVYVFMVKKVFVLMRFLFWIFGFGCLVLWLVCEEFGDGC